MIYHVDAERVDLGRRVARVVFALVFFAVGAYVVRCIWPSPKSQRERIEDYIGDGIICVLTAFFADSVRKKYDLEVDDESIQMRRGWFGNHRVRRGHIRYVREYRGNLLHEPALRIAERGAIGRFFWGYVSIPASLPEYQQIRAKVMTWARIG